MEIGVDGKIFTHKKIKGSMGQQYPYSTRWENTIVPIIHFLELEPGSYYYMFTKTLNLNNVKYILGYLNQYPPIKYIKGSMGNRYLYSTRWEGGMW